MKVKLVLNKEFPIDLDASHNSDIKQLLIERIADQQDVEQSPDLVKNHTFLHDAVRESLADDINDIVDLDLDEHDFEITVED